MNITIAEAVSRILRCCLGTGGGELRLDCRTQSGFGHQVLIINSVLHGWLPLALSGLLADRGDWFVTIRPVVHVGEAPRRLHTLFARWRFTPAFQGSEFVIPAELRAATDSSLRAFSLSPAAVIDAATSVVALWPLEQPFDVSTDGGLRVARALQRRLTTRLQASTGTYVHSEPSSGMQPARTCEFTDDDPMGFLPLVGQVRDCPASPRRLVRVSQLSERAYSLAAVEAALEGKVGL